MTRGLGSARGLPYNGAVYANRATQDPRLKLMKTPKRIEPLVEAGLVDEVMRPLMSGKEAAVYVVRCGDELRCAKVYKIGRAHV